MLKHHNIKKNLSNENTFFNKIIFILIIFLILSIPYSINSNLTNVPELEYHDYQTLKLLIPSKKCKCTLFFTSHSRNNTIDNDNNNYRIIEYKNRKNYFVTYYLDDVIYNQFEPIFIEHGLIRSNHILADNNFYLSKKYFDLFSNSSKFLRLNNFKKLYRFFGYQVLMKDSLYFNYKEMKKEFDEDYNYMSETYYYPDDKKIIREKFENYTLNKDDLWLVKPSHKSGGKGIEILESLKKIKLTDFLLNKYITNLDLINNKKYDLRLYILVTGLKPLRIYCNQEGLVRIAANNFTLNEEFIKNRYVHLTNVGVSLKSKDFISPDNSSNEDANIWTLQMYSKRLKKNNIDINELKKNINDIIIKSIISVYKNLTEELTNNKLNDMNFFDLLGYDIIITKNFEPILLEINSGPSIVYHNELEKKIKTNLIVDMFNLVGISLFNKNMAFYEKKEIKNSVEDNVQNALCELKRPRGDFELIFPLKENIDTYNKFFKGRNNEENTVFWNIIKNGG